MVDMDKILNYDEENIRLVNGIQAGNEELFSELLELNKGLVFRVIKKFTPNSEIDKDTIYSIAIMALFKASQEFKPNGKAKFITFAFKYMMNAITREFQGLEYCGRKELYLYNASLYKKVGGTRNDNSQSVLMDLLDGGEDSYFVHELQISQEAVAEAMESVRTDMRPYVIPLIIGDLTQAEVTRELGISKQLVHHYSSRFKNIIKEYLIDNGYEHEEVF